MTFDPTDPYAPPRTELQQHLRARRRLKQSEFGIASVSITVLAAAMMIGFIASVLVITPSAQLFLYVGFTVLSVLALNLVGTCLGIAGLIQRERSKTLAVLGLAFNLLMLGGMSGLLFIGVAFG